MGAMYSKIGASDGKVDFLEYGCYDPRKQFHQMWFESIRRLREQECGRSVPRSAHDVPFAKQKKKRETFLL